MSTSQPAPPLAEHPDDLHPVGLEPAAQAAPAPAPLGLARGLLRSVRPRQWVKNVLVLAAPAAAGALDQAEILGPTLLAFVAFCLVSSGTYLINDVRDVEADRRHPTKRNRPIAAGKVPVRTAAIVGVVLLVVGIALATAVELALGGLVAGYAALTAAYSLALKHEAVFDIAIVASGFFMRAIAGGLATGLDISRWFLIVTAFGSLYMVAGKRYAEVVAFGDGAHRVRASLAHYSKDYLDQVISIAAGVTILGFCLWAFEGRPGGGESTWTALSVIPFVLGIMRYGLLVDRGNGGEPEEIVLGDRQLQLIGLAWLVLFGLGVYL